MIDLASEEVVTSFSTPHDLETMYPEPIGEFLYVPDENDRSGVHAYLADGGPYLREGTHTFGTDEFDADGEGVWMVSCPADSAMGEGSGFVIVSDQREAATDFEVYDRVSWEHLGTFQLTGVSNTDGIGITQQASALFPGGLFAGINNDTSVAGIGLEKIRSAAGLNCD